MSLDIRYCFLTEMKMTLQQLLRQAKKAFFYGAAFTLLTPSYSIGQEIDPILKEKKESEYGPMVHEMRKRRVIDPVISGEITDYTEARRVSFESWKRITNPYALKPAGATAWQSISTTGSQGGLISGRARSIAFHPTDPNTIWVATAQGGIWRTNDIYGEAPEWVNLSESLPTLAMGAIAVDPRNPDILLAGTGETVGGFSSDNMGLGLFRSVDGGLNWTLVAGTDVAGLSCSQIVFHPTDSKIVFVATGNAKGLLKSTDGGLTYKKVSTSGFPVSIAINHQDPNFMYYGAQGGGVFRSVDGGETWTKVSAITGGNRAQVAIAPSSPNVVYASALQTNATHIWHSTDNGENWTRKNIADVPPMENRNSTNVNYLWNTTQGNYANALVVDPQNPKYLFAGGLFIVFSTDEGTRLSVRNDNFGDAGANNFVHADIQFLAYNSDGKLFCLSDGGVAYATDRTGRNWIKKPNQKLNTLQFVGVDADKQMKNVIGGTQDNGTNRAAEGAAHWTEIRGGDGGMVRIAQSNPLIVYGTSVNFNNGGSQSIIFKSETGGIGSPRFVMNNQGNDNIATNPSMSNAMDFYPVYDISEDGSIVAVSAGTRVFVSESGGTDDFPVSPATGLGARPNSVHISQSSSNLMWAGTNKAIWRTEDQGRTWERANIVNLNGDVTGIVADYQNPLAVFAVSAGAGATPNRNFARSYDGGKTWEMPATNLPSIPAHSIARSIKGHLYVGTEYGVIYSTDDGASWAQLGQGLPKVQVLSIHVRGEADQYLLAGTYGRGAYVIDISSVGSVEGSPNVNRTIALSQSYPNPVTASTSEATINFNLEKSGIAQIALLDMLGREVMMLARDYYTAGEHQVKVPVAALEAGTYVYALTSDGQTITEKLVVTK
jgi:photosystem II stability/assembly factor-like uncharacterized protein